MKEQPGANRTTRKKQKNYLIFTEMFVLAVLDNTVDIYYLLFTDMLLFTD